MRGDPRFLKLSKEELELHANKQEDYGAEGDPFANVRSAMEFGVPAWVGALIRMNDKMTRLKKAAKGGTLTNEGVIDSLMDISVYAKIAVILYREAQDA